ncbi:hypothetical protein MMA231_03588 (plasmid) [Asticcacaulis sp. MM231]
MILSHLVAFYISQHSREYQKALLDPLFKDFDRMESLAEALHSTPPNLIQAIAEMQIVPMP